MENIKWLSDKAFISQAGREILAWTAQQGEEIVKPYKILEIGTNQKIDSIIA